MTDMSMSQELERFCASNNINFSGSGFLGDFCTACQSVMHVREGRRDSACARKREIRQRRRHMIRRETQDCLGQGQRRAESVELGVGIPREATPRWFLFLFFIFFISEMRRDTTPRRFLSQRHHSTPFSVFVPAY